MIDDVDKMTLSLLATNEYLEHWTKLVGAEMATVQILKSHGVQTQAEKKMWEQLKRSRPKGSKGN